MIQYPSNKYLPVQQYQHQQHQHPVKYYSTNIKTPPKKYYSQGYTPTVVHHPHPQGYEPPVSYQSVSYFSASAPLDVPTTDVIKGSNYPSPVSTHGNDGHTIVRWPPLPEQYSQQISNKLNEFNYYSYGGIQAPQYLSPEVNIIQILLLLLSLF